MSQPQQPEKRPSKLQSMDEDAGFLKAGFLGFQKSGKTFTAKELAIGTREYFGLKGPIAMYDTEGGSVYIKNDIRKRTGVSLTGKRSRSFRDLIELGQTCVDEGASVLIVDSLTHIWRDLCKKYLEQKNAMRAKRKKPPQSGLEFQDWAAVKGLWEHWSDFYLNSPLHIIVCGRAGFEYDFEENSDGKRELIKTGTKMKTESEFGFEPSLLVEMERVNRNGRHVHQATVIGDRFSLIDGRQAVDPGFDFFLPFIEQLNPESHAFIEEGEAVDFGMDTDGNDYGRQRKIYLEEIEGELARAFSQTAKDKKERLNTLEKVFGTTSWTRISSMGAERVKEGLVALRVELRGGDQEPDAETQETEEEIAQFIGLNGSSKEAQPSV